MDKLKKYYELGYNDYQPPTQFNDEPEVGVLLQIKGYYKNFTDEQINEYRRGYGDAYNECHKINKTI